MGVNAGLGLGLALHDREVRHGFAGTLAGTGELFAIHVDERHVGGLHETLGDERRGGKDQVVADADGDVATVAVSVGLGVEAAADVAHALLEHHDGGRIEEGLDLRRGLRIGAGRPLVLHVRDAGFDCFVRAGGRSGGGGAGQHRGAAAQGVARGGGENGIGGYGGTVAKQRFDVLGGDDLAHGGGELWIKNESGPRVKR